MLSMSMTDFAKSVRQATCMGTGSHWHNTISMGIIYVIWVSVCVSGVSVGGCSLVYVCGVRMSQGDNVRFGIWLLASGIRILSNMKTAHK